MAKLTTKRRLHLLVVAVGIAGLLVFFQNCTGLSAKSPAAIARGLSSPAPSPSPLPVDDEPTLSYAERRAALDTQRLREWTPTHPYWEVFWDGEDTPADNVPGPFMWDNPIDDDWYEPLVSGYDYYWVPFRLNTYYTTASRGFMTVDRTFAIGSNQKTGSIFRRDEYLDPEFTHALYGVTIELRVKLLSTSGKGAFFINYVGRDCTASVALSGSTADSPVGEISSGSVYGNHTNAKAFDTTTDMVTLRLVRNPGVPTFDVYLVAYADKNANKPITFQKIHEAACLSEYKVGSSFWVHFPYIQIGDNSNESHSNAAFIIDYARYRRDAVHPNEILPSVHPRTPVPLPESGTDEHLFTSGYLGVYSGGYFGEGLPWTDANASVMGKIQPRGTVSTFSQQSDGIMRLLAGPEKKNSVDIEVLHPKGIVDGGAWTMEVRAKVHSTSGERGFRMAYMDTYGAITLFLSPGKVETALGTKPAGFLSYTMDTTDRFHIYRLVRKAGDIYAQLYIDNDPIPKIVDQHLSAESENAGRNPSLWFGTVEIFPQATGWPRLWTHGDIDVDYVRWHGYAIAPTKINDDV